ncbi:MAG: complex I NDUFA9 subunit family protein [Fimbriimonadaceae bacterium]|nr:complex I NDUFA9 subunit family protein [Fimbriimonadaceae bacterium]
MVLVTGATGFLGGHLITRLLADGVPLRALVRPRSPHQFLARRGVDLAFGDVADPASLPAACAGCSAVLHLVGLLREPPGVTFEAVVAEGTRSLVDAAVTAGVQRFVYVSAIGARADAPSRYHRTKAAAEAAVRAAALDHVIVRPSIVYGPGDALTSLFLKVPVPLPGGGHNYVQPVAVSDLVEILAQALRRPEVAGQTYEVGGPTAVTFAEFVRELARVSGSRLPHPPLPMRLAEAQAWVFDALKKPLYRLGLEPPLSTDQLLMLAEDNVCDVARVQRDFGLALTDLTTGLRRQLAPQAA